MVRASVLVRTFFAIFLCSAAHERTLVKYVPFQQSVVRIRDMEGHIDSAVDSATRTSRRLVNVVTPEGGPLEEVADTYLVAADPEFISITKNDTAVIIFGQDVDLTLTELWSPGLDLYVSAVHARLPDLMKFSPPENRNWVRNVHIHALQITLPPEGSTIDVSGANGRPQTATALSGTRVGDPAGRGAMKLSEGGADGEEGEPGYHGGRVTIQCKRLDGEGMLTIRANGGDGAAGQDGGDGVHGHQGLSRRNTEACCEDEEVDRVTSGQRGYPGGPAGDGGRGGNPGDAGHIEVVILDQQHLIKVQTTAAPGKVGVGGRPGKPGPGGLGGPGLGTLCVNNGFFGRDRGCAAPVGERGSNGPEGKEGREGKPGREGAEGEIKANSTSLEEMRDDKCGPWMRFEMRYADKLYMNKRLAEAKEVYEWVQAVRESSNATCGTEFDSRGATLWFERKVEAQTRLLQINLNEDYWGKSPGYAPLSSYNDLASTATQAAATLRGLEEMYMSFEGDFLSNEAAMNLLSKQASNLDYEVLMGEKTKARLSRQIKMIREHIIHDDHVMMTYGLDLNNRGGGCNDAIYKKTIGERYSLDGRMTIMGDMFDRTMTVVDDTVARVDGIQLTADNVMTNGNLLVDAVSSVFTGGLSTSTLPLSQVWPILQTMIGQVNSLDASMTKMVDVPMQLMQDLIDERESRRARTNTIITQVTPEQLEFLKDEWYGDLKECQSIKTALDAYQKLASERNVKKKQHDDLVKEYAEIERVSSQARLTRESLISDNIHGFNHISSQLMHAVYESYFIQKRQLVSIFKQMEAAMNREFCENEELELEDAKAAQLDAYLAKLMARWQYSQSTQRQESVIYGNFDHGLGQGGQEVRAVRSVLFDRASYVNEFDKYGVSGVFEASVGWTDVSLPEGGKNVRVVSAQAFLPEQLKFDSDPVQVWMQRNGNSECIGADGTLRSFAHAQHSYYTMYTAEPSAEPTYLTAADSVAERPSAVGRWTIVTPQLDRATRESITKIELNLVLSYTPCPSQECLDRSQALHSGTGTSSALKSQMVAQTLFSRAGWGVGVVMVGTAVAALTLIMAHSLLRGSQNSTLRSQEHEVPQDQCEQAILARGRTLRRQPDVSPASSQ